jgi:L-lactate dehydrogenase (cytochrome)
MLSLEDFEAEARGFLPRPIFGYISGGVETDASLRGNRTAFQELHFLPRVLVNTRGRTQKRTLLGRSYDLPFGFPPMGGTSLAAYDGDRALARAAAALNRVVPGVPARRPVDYHAARPARAERRLRTSRADGGRADGRQSRE